MNERAGKTQDELRCIRPPLQPFPQGEELKGDMQSRPKWACTEEEIGEKNDVANPTWACFQAQVS